MLSLASDGVYGFLTHRELDRRSWGRPSEGQAPEREIIVDTVAPQVKWLAPLGLATADGKDRAPARISSKALLGWLASDEHLSQKPIRLDYRVLGTVQLVAEHPGLAPPLR